MNLDLNELVGIIGSLFIIAAFTLKDLRWVRIVDCIGAAIFVVYGILIQSISVSLLNSVAIAVNIFHLIKDSIQKTELKKHNE